MKTLDINDYLHNSYYLANPKYFIELVQILNKSHSGFYRSLKYKTHLVDWITKSLPLLTDPFFATSTKISWILNDRKTFPVCTNPKCQYYQTDTMFKKKKPFNPYENRVDELLYEVWEERDRVYEKTTQVITRLGVIDLYPEGADRKKAVSDAEKAKQSLLVAIGAYDTARMEYNDYVKKYAEKFDSPKKEWTTTSHEIVEWAYRFYNKE